ncbi:ABC transporter ATP-binding protein [Geobacter anodireducens]|mgnify:CR=1 FL=1|uniref:Peptide ABC transporter ATP-binding protein n=1 Tax=Geobacter soli TaxID=1510391 RepID=A0A0C1QLP7_9BACT|nr:oligopeptide/dipeptide ABC transporter ATP-binding protein [Geobacter soli]KIE41522.1 peptide ABC transporter ATP-binding protein [Geobacter soli]HMN02253.1 ATP-binding cassette domain-containing protein [Geobacter anodireducens]
MTDDHLLSAENLSKAFSVSAGPFSPRRELRAVSDVTFGIAPGETLGLAGESGCGKSTVGKLLMGLIPPDAGIIRFNGRDVAHMTRDERQSFRKDVQMIFQDPFSSLNPRMRVADIVGEALDIHGLAPRGGRRARTLELLDMVGLQAGHADRYPHEFSGGQRQRIGIARAIAVSPRVIVADEPVSALDLSIQAQIINLLQQLKRDLGLSYLFIAHDLSVVRHLSDRVAVMYLGKIVEIGTRDAVFSRFQHPYTEALLSAVPRVKAGSSRKRIILAGDPPSPITPPPACPFHPRCPYVETICRSEIPPLEEKEPGHLAACHLSKKLFGMPAPFS